MKRSSLIRKCLVAVLCGLFCLAASGATTPPKKKTAKTSTASRSKTAAHKKRSRTKAKSKSSKTRGQNVIESERAQQIQEALIREHYMDGEPSGKMDDATQAALRRYQADQGWQSKSVPDSRALIKLGLGPNHDHLLNPETAMTTVPAGHASAPAKPAANAGSPTVPSEATPHR
jgi:peptidoglycan hydrolase-like protein with peptidoglycan-binding domain